MNKMDKSMILIGSIIIGFLCMLSPIIITGTVYDTNRVMGSLLTAEFVVRTLAIIIGLIIIYDGVKSHFKK